MSNLSGSSTFGFEVIGRRPASAGEKTPDRVMPKPAPHGLNNSAESDGRSRAPLATAPRFVTSRGAVRVCAFTQSGES
jgi:hypothetical protein